MKGVDIMPKIAPDKLAALKETMRDYMTEYYKSEVAFVKQIKGLLYHVNEKDNLLGIKKVIDDKLIKTK